MTKLTKTTREQAVFNKIDCILYVLNLSDALILNMKFVNECFHNHKHHS